MILWTQQYRIISNIFNSFKKGIIQNKENPFSSNELDKSRMFLNPEKFQNYTLSNFKVLIIYEMWKRYPASKIEFLKILNSISKEEVLEFRKFKSDLESFKFIKERDLKILEELVINPYEAYDRGLINILTLGISKVNEGELGIIGRSEYKRAKTLVKFFRFN